LRADWGSVLARAYESNGAPEMVGILLPPSFPPLVNYAAMLLGKVPVNLN